MKKTSCKNFISMLLCFLIIFTIPGQAVFAKSNDVSNVKVENKDLTIKILSDNSTFKEVEVSDGTDVSVVKYDKQTGAVDLKVNNEAVLTENMSISPNIIESLDQKITTEEISTYSAQSSYGSSYDTGNDISFDYYYSASTDGSWYITIPNNSKLVDEKTKNPNTGDYNSVPLNSFRDKVNSLYVKQLEIAGAFGTGTLSVIVACLTAAPETLGTTAVVALCVAAGAAIGAAVLGAQAYFLAKDARYYFNRVY